METKKYRCHFSIIFESLWQFWIVIFFIIFNEIEVIIDVIQEVGTKGIIELLREGGLWGFLVLLVITIGIFGFQFFRWRKTWISLEDNLVIIERNTLRKIKNTIAIENISAVNMERNLFERVVGTYKIKMDTNSLSTANETDVSIVFSEDMAIEFRRLVLERINALKGNGETPALSEERTPDEIFEEKAEGKKVFHCSTKDMFMHALYSMPLFSLIISIAGIAGAMVYISYFGWLSFFKEAIGGFIALAFIVVSSIWSVVKRFIIYYNFTVYRDGKDLHVKCGLIKLKSYTIPVDKITAIQIEQPFFSRFFKKYNTKVVTVGVGDEDGESSNITMSLSLPQLREQLEELIPEYDWARIENVVSEDKAGVFVRVIKSIKWHIITISAILLLTMHFHAPWWAGILIPLACDAYINLLYVLSHKASGYNITDDGMVLSSGMFNKVYMVCTYEKAQYMIKTIHPAAKKYGVADGIIMLLNSAASLPYVKNDILDTISDRIIGGTK